MPSKALIATGFSVGIIVIIIIVVIYIPNLANMQQPSNSSADSAKTGVTVKLPDNSEVKMTVDRPAIWNHEESRDFDNNSFTVKVAKTLSASGSLVSRSIVPFNASIHVTNHYMDNYATFSQWQNFTNANDWVIATFDKLNDSDTLFVTVYENKSPVLNMMESGR